MARLPHPNWGASLRSQNLDLYCIYIYIVYIYTYIFRIGSSYWGPVPSIASSVKPKAEIPGSGDFPITVTIPEDVTLSAQKMVGIGISKMLSKWCLANGKCMKMCHSDFPYQLSCPSQDPRPMERKSIIRAIPCEVRETPRFCSRRSCSGVCCGFWRSLWRMKSPNFLKHPFLAFWRGVLATHKVPFGVKCDVGGIQFYEKNKASIQSAAIVKL